MSRAHPEELSEITLEHPRYPSKAGQVRFVLAVDPVMDRRAGYVHTPRELGVFDTEPVAGSHNAIGS